MNTHSIRNSVQKFIHFILSGRVYHIIREYLSVRQLCAKYLRHKLTIDQYMVIRIRLCKTKKPEFLASIFYNERNMVPLFCSEVVIEY